MSRPSSAFLFPVPLPESKVIADLTRNLQIAALVVEAPRRRAVEIHAYVMALRQIRSTLQAMGHFAPNVVMRGCWDDQAFEDAVAEGLEANHQNCEIVVELIDLPAGDESFIPLRPRGRVDVTVGYKRGHDGMDSITHKITFTADCEVIEANDRKLAIYTVVVDE